MGEVIPFPKRSVDRGATDTDQWMAKVAHDPWKDAEKYFEAVRIAVRLLALGETLEDCRVP